MRLLLPVVVFGLALTACADNTSDTKADSSVAQVAIAPKADTARRAVEVPPLVKKGDTLVIDSRAAIFIRPDSARIAKEKKQGSEDDFDVIANDYSYYTGTARYFLDSVKVTIIDVNKENFIRFVGPAKRSQIIAISKIPEPWSIYFFDPAKQAKQVDMTAIEDEYQAYFK